MFLVGLAHLRVIVEGYSDKQNEGKDVDYTTQYLLRVYVAVVPSHIHEYGGQIINYKIHRQKIHYED